MDAKTCLEKLKEVGILAFATVDAMGNPQVRNISAIHYEEDAMYVYTARGKEFWKEILETGKVQILAYTQSYEMIRFSAKVTQISLQEQTKWRDEIFAEHASLSEVYPGDTREIGGVFCLKDGEIEYFNLSKVPIFRESYVIGEGKVKPKGYIVSEACTGCGVCASHCPQGAIEVGTPSRIKAEHCLHCGNCENHCPSNAVVRL